MVPILAKKRPTTDAPKEAAPEVEMTWAIFARISLELRPRVEAYMKSHKFRPKINQVVELALRELVEREGF